MNHDIIDYLTKNKDQYPQEALITQLRKAGHAHKDIAEAINVVYRKNMTSQDNTSQQKSGQYWIGFVLSFFGILIFNFLALILFGILYHVLKKEHHNLAVGMLHGMRTILIIILGLIILSVIISQLSMWY